MSRVFGLTGGIASGKSTVSKILKEHGVPIVDADGTARKIVEPGSLGLQLIVREFGPDFLLEDGRLDRAKLGAMVFTQTEKLQKLESFISPLLLEACGNEMRTLQAEGHPLICFDAALLVERNLHEKFRPLVVVATSVSNQVERMMSRDGFNEEEARARINCQFPLDKKVALADYVITNDGDLNDLTDHTLTVLQDLQEKYR